MQKQGSLGSQWTTVLFAGCLAGGVARQEGGRAHAPPEASRPAGHLGRESGCRFAAGSWRTALEWLLLRPAPDWKKGKRHHHHHEAPTHPRLATLSSQIMVTR